MASSRLSDILSPTSSTMTNAVFGSARARRPSTPKSPLADLSQSQPQPLTPRSQKALPPLPASKSQSSKAKGHPDQARPDSPDVEMMIACTPRPRRKSSATFPSSMSRMRSNGSMVVPSSWKGLKSKDSFNTGEENESLISEFGILSEDEDDKNGDGGSESDSSIDIHTPLPHLMFRDGLLSPRSKLLPGGGATTQSMYLDNDDEPSLGNRANSVLSVVSTAASTKTKSGIHRDPRDTERRRHRHRDQQLLRAGMGLTTGLGWSDSEDEDAPSLLTRRLITTNIERQPSLYAPGSRAPSQLAKSVSAGNIFYAPPSYSPGLRAASKALSRSASASFSHTRLSTADSASVTSADTRPTRSRTQSNASASSIVSSGSHDSNSAPQSVTSSEGTASRMSAAVPRPLRLPQSQSQKAAGARRAVTRSASITAIHPPVASASTKIAGPTTRTRTRTLSNPGSRPPNSPLSRSASSRPGGLIPPSSLSQSVMAPVRPTPVSYARNGVVNDPLSEFPLPPGLSSPGLARPSVNTQIQKPTGIAMPLSAPPTQLPNSVGTGPRPRVLNTVGTGPRPPRTGTGMVYRNSSYTGSYYESSRGVSRASVASNGKKVGVI